MVEFGGEVVEMVGGVMTDVGGEVGAVEVGGEVVVVENGGSVVEVGGEVVAVDEGGEVEVVEVVGGGVVGGGGQTESHGMVPSSTCPYFCGVSEHDQAPSSSTVAGWGVSGWAGHTMAMSPTHPFTMSGEGGRDQL